MKDLSIGANIAWQIAAYEAAAAKFQFIEKEHIALNILRSSLLKPHILSFPQAERVGNPSENKERFRTSRNDRVSGHVALLSFSLVSHRLSSLRTISAIILWLKFIH